MGRAYAQTHSPPGRLVVQAHDHATHGPAGDPFHGFALVKIVAVLLQFVHQALFVFWRQKCGLKSVAG